MIDLLPRLAQRFPASDFRHDRSKAASCSRHATPWVYAHRIARRHRHHRRVDRLVGAGGAGDSRNRQPDACQNNLRQIGVAIHNYDATYKSFPAGVRTSTTGSNHCVASWAVSLLPFLEQDPLFSKLDFSQRFYDVANPPPGPLPNVDMLKGFATPIFICPSSSLPTLICPEDLNSISWGKHIQAGNYVGIMGACNGPNDATEPGSGLTGRVSDIRPAAPIQLHHGGIRAFNGIFFNQQKIRNKDITDGTSNTIMVGEQSDWGADPGVGTAAPNPRLDIRQTFRAGLWAASTIEGMSSSTVRYPINTKVRVSFQDGIARYGWNNPIQSTHPGGANVLRCDASVAFGQASTPFDVLKYMCVRDDAQVFTVDW